MIEKVPYFVERSRRRTVALRVEVDGSVRVSAPFFTPRFWIERFVQTHARWIFRQQKRLAERRTVSPPRAFVSGDYFPWQGEDCRLQVVTASSDTTESIRAVERKLHVSLPASVSGTPKTVRSLLRQWYQSQTESQIKEKLDFHAARLGVRYRRMSVVEQKRRWGSCSRRGELRFNWRLSMLPPEALEYVVVHELAHLRVMDHSPRFWAEVAAVLPDYKERRKLVRRHAPRTEFPF